MAGFTDLTKEETLAVTGEAQSVMDADRLAWEALESVLGPDPVEAWMLTKMVHAVKGRGKLEWMATFHRDPEHPSPPNTVTEVAKITDATGRSESLETVEEKQEEGAS